MRIPRLKSCRPERRRLQAESRRSPAGNASCGNYRQRSRAANHRSKNHCIKLSDMPAALSSLGNDCVGSALSSTLPALQATTGITFHPPVPVGHIFRRVPCASRDDRDFHLGAKLCHLVSVLAHQHDIDAERAVCQGAKLFYLLSYI